MINEDKRMLLSESEIKKFIDDRETISNIII